MAEERFKSTGDLSASASSFSSSSPDSTASSASSDDITDSGNSSWDFSPPPMPDCCNDGPLFHMKSLRASLPSRKRGLSNFFTGKSQSFTSLADVRCVEDLGKPQKKLRNSHSWESSIDSSFNNQIIRSLISAESVEMPRKASFSPKMNKKSNRLIACRLLRSPPKRFI